MKMSAAKMVADSTQSEPVESSVTSSKTATKSKAKRKKPIESKKIKKLKKSTKKIEKKRTENEDPEMNLEKVVKSIGSYIKDRQEMANQMFTAVHGTSLQRALPNVLKEFPLKELKMRCVEQLEMMSKKRIRRILAGDDPASISSSGTDEDNSDEDVKRDVVKIDDQPQSREADSTSRAGASRAAHFRDIGAEASQILKDGAKSSASQSRAKSPEENSESEAGDYTEQSPSDGEEKMDVVSDDDGGEGESKVEKDFETMQAEIDNEISASLQAEDEELSPSTNTIAPIFTQNQMELLELELRAKAIKAMLSKMNK